MGILQIPSRPSKPRQYGWTVVNDRGIGLNAWADIWEMAGNYVDFAKLGIGTAYLMQNLHEKITYLQPKGIEVVLGGTLFETFWAQQHLDAYRSLLDSSGLRWVEISSGSYPIPLEEKITLVREFSQHYRYRVMAEVGQKAKTSRMTPQDYAQEALRLREAGADKVILEGRGNGRGGIYDDHGNLDTGILETVLGMIPVEDVIFEAPLESQQVLFICQFGSNVNLGNVCDADVLALEALRVGLRYDTIQALGLPRNAHEIESRMGPT